MVEFWIKTENIILIYRILLSEIGEIITILEKYTPEIKSRY